MKKLLAQDLFASDWQLTLLKATGSCYAMSFDRYVVKMELML